MHLKVHVSYERHHLHRAKQHRVLRTSLNSKRLLFCVLSRWIDNLSKHMPSYFLLRYRIPFSLTVRVMVEPSSTQVPEVGSRTPYASSYPPWFLLSPQVPAAGPSS
ncbi:hypothetical protein PM082_017141 [Marasmius tenuissimus]|nr:hypothetical protein PM082_017141 [Marasmius tenuissimus]